jgi:hypothetical protein
MSVVVENVTKPNGLPAWRRLLDQMSKVLTKSVDRDAFDLGGLFNRNPTLAAFVGGEFDTAGSSVGHRSLRRLIAISDRYPPNPG